MLFFQLKHPFYKSARLKTMLLFVTVFYCSCSLNAQGESNIRLAIEVGILPLPSASENLGLFLNIEPNIRMTENTFLGLRAGITFNSHQFDNDDSFEFIINKTMNHAVISFVPTFDYYVNQGKYHPYVGFGLGIHLQPYDIEAFRAVAANPSEHLVEGNVNKRIGFLVRGGVEPGKWRLGFEYNFIPKADIKIPNGQIIGTVKNGYLGLSIRWIIAGKRKED